MSMEDEEEEEESGMEDEEDGDSGGLVSVFRRFSQSPGWSFFHSGPGGILFEFFINWKDLLICVLQV